MCEFYNSLWSYLNQNNEQTLHSSWFLQTIDFERDRVQKFWNFKKNFRRTHCDC